MYGQVTAWHYLADIGADLSRTFAIEAGDTLQILLYEYFDKFGCITPGVSNWSNPPYISWWVTEVTLTGATTNLLGVATFATALAALSF